MTTPSVFGFYILLALSIPLAYLGSFIERYHRTLQNRAYDYVVELITNNQTVPFKKIKIISTVQYFFINAFTFFISCITIYYIIHFMDSLSQNPDPNQINWPILWAISMIGGILSIRIKEAYIALISGFIVMGMIILLGIL